MADRRTRARRIIKVHKPAMMRSEARRFGDRFRPRFRIRTWCRIKTDSATTERSPPGRPSLSEAVSDWAILAVYLGPPVSLLSRISVLYCALRVRFAAQYRRALDR